MSLLIALIIGGIVGWVAGQVAGRDEGPVTSVLIGIIGSILGGALSTVFGGSNQSYLLFTWTGFLWSFIGALILVIILNAVQYRSHRI
jgi:uncharacterized membrane protein YeaQ/YmgE (transglycosylase-associated protein family)